jgi:uncharacterized protein (TIGR02231 family)
MKRILLTTALCATLPFAAQAEDILIRADLVEATVFGSGADVSREGTVTIPAGRHRLLIAMPDLNEAQLPQITGTGSVRFGPPQAIQGHPVEEGALDDAGQAAAREATEAARDAVQAAQDALAQADVAIRSIETQQAYIAAILRGGDSGVAMPDDPAMVAQFLSTLGEQTARLSDDLLQTQVARRDLAEAVTDAQRVYADATQAFNALRPFGLQVGVFAVDVTVAEDTEAELNLSYFTNSAGWRPSYELDLDTDTGALAIDRFVTLQTYGAARWQDVAVTFSTSAPDRTREPSEVYSRPARLQTPSLSDLTAGEALQDVDSRIASRPEIAGYAAGLPALVVESAPIVAEFNGLAVSYPYPEPVSVSASGTLLLPFDTLELEVETENRAVPRWDATAFLIAMAENDTGEPILPGQARFYRDGALIGEGGLPLIPAGAEAEMAFGALDHLQLTWIDRSLAEGDRGLFVSSNTQARQIAFGVENTGDAAEEVRVLYATPFAEQEDLEMDLTLSPRPSEEDFEDQRGVSAWDLAIAPGEEALIEMTVEFEFPDGQILDWHP